MNVTHPNGCGLTSMPHFHFNRLTVISIIKSIRQTAAAKMTDAAVRIVKLAPPTAYVAAASAMRGVSCAHPHVPLCPTIDTLPRNAPTRSRRPLRRSLQAHRFIVAASLASRPRTPRFTRRARLLFVHSTIDTQSPFTPASTKILSNITPLIEIKITPHSTYAFI
ncbi:hypothetical protein [Burkholderia sp. ABCPW 14]|uniref:hypothetical protein n=1 Tax=Burkholderia sp. ABCPW 14 TaxID=1637860 RepID=UPI0012E3C3BC|nr:hypothetical protein [Burkholderia sp. ABCPW 14]